ncbi:MAG: pre-peptidase C-terminal domain-containing protein [Nodosilinea sp. WJT8-NPBG4]|nr:pre-peptidase C-terminal domain-containing protein [Nodosilinea sp. WJT8-NPBG4]
MRGVTKVRSWLYEATIVLLATLAAAPAQGQSTAILQEALRLAVCLNDWDSAIAHTSQLEQVSELPVKTRAQLVAFRRQMQLFDQNRTVVNPIDGCEPVLAGFGLPGYTGRPLDFDRGVYSSVGRGAPVVAADQTLRQYEALWQAGLGVTADTPLSPLAEAQRVNTRSGSGVTTGAVSRRVDIYAFLGAEGDSANLDLTVIQQRRGLLYTDDAAQLFLFDAAGRLLSAGRTTAGQQPYLAATPLPASGVYYAAVTTPQHHPVLDEGGFITGWQGIGTSAVTYTITIDGLTPSPELGLR